MWMFDPSPKKVALPLLCGLNQKKTDRKIKMRTFNEINCATATHGSIKVKAEVGLIWFYFMVDADVFVFYSLRSL